MEQSRNKNQEVDKFAADTKTIYRIEKDYRSLWYDKEGRFEPIIKELCPYGIAKNFPMPMNKQLHRKDGLVWYSAGKSIENMNEWFSPQDAKNLVNNEFKLFKFEVEMYQELEMEILFCREGILSKKEIPLEVVWDLDI